MPGISHTDHKPAVRRTIEYACSSGFHVGGRASNVTWVGDFQGADVSAPSSGSSFRGSPNNGVGNGLETRVHAGVRGSFAGDFTFGVWAVYCSFPGKCHRDRGSAASLGVITPAAGGTLGPWANPFGKNLGDPSFFVTVTRAF